MKLHRPSAGTIIATVALAVAAGGTADAAGIVTIGTSQIKNGAVTNTKIHKAAVGPYNLNAASKKLIASSTAGKTGATGPQGPKGDKGDKGDTGPAGPIGPAGANGANGVNGTNGTNGANGSNPATEVNNVPAIPAGSTTDVGATGDSGFYFEGVSNAGTGDARSNANAFIANGQLVIQGSGTDGTTGQAPGIAKAYSTSLGSLTALSYQWQNNVTTTSNGGGQTPQAPSIDIRVTAATTDGGTTDLIYTPGLNNTNATTGAAACSSAPIATITEGVYWEQDTFATSNCWFSSADAAGSTGGSGNPISIQQFQQRNPTAQIQSIGITDGGGVGTTGNFSAGADDLLIGVNGSNTRYDFGS